MVGNDVSGTHTNLHACNNTLKMLVVVKAGDDDKC